MKKLRITFYWQGISNVKIRNHWGDGLYAAMKIIEKDHHVTYQEPWEDPPEGTDILLYWEAPGTFYGENGRHYQKVQRSPIPKILLFAGGQVKNETCAGFDLFLIESKINEGDFDSISKPYMTAFGVDTSVLKPELQPKMWDAVMPGTCAGWKRQRLFSRALGSRGVLCGRNQDIGFDGFMDCRKKGTMVFDEIPYHAVNALYNASYCCVNTSEFWGGGQRITLEAMAAGIPVVAMSDSPKNREYVEESGCGLVCEPSEEAIQKAVDSIKTWDIKATQEKCLKYIHSKWTEKHYADAIMAGINKVLKI